ncbi:MAG: hypothetical protein CMC76_07100 [Flavobacteriaceae bacterium]|nr:hypothetical protein [Flavobacteriaceae bacterium]|tara:strand:+ start:7305 stop:7751 length:447 start_codon:yes stop_codon:yes gene_type:complete
MKYIILTILMCFSIVIKAQNSEPSTTFNGKYHLMDAERASRGETTKIKYFEFGEHNGLQLLAVAACEKCMSAVYTYKPEESKEIERLVFFNKVGLIMIQYDKESFVMIMPNPNSDNWLDFMFSNFYSKSKTKAEQMTQEKIKTFIDEL